MKTKKFVKTPDGEEVKLDRYGKIPYKDKNKVIPGVPGIKKFREEVKKLKQLKVKY